MDVIAHGLWGGAVFYAQGRKKFFAGVLLGMAPDLLSFGVFHVTHPGWFTERLAGKISGPPALTLLPRYVFHAYNVTHSLVVWAVAFFLLWQLMKKPRSEEHTSELQSPDHLVCRLLLEKKKI